MKLFTPARPACDGEPLSRMELWFIVVGVYLVVASFLVGHFTASAAEETHAVIPLTQNA